VFALSGDAGAHEVELLEVVLRVTSLSLESMSDYFACPGEAVANDQLDFSTL
jgi:hypothetical protein